MVTTAPPQQGTYRARLERAIRRRDLAAWGEHVALGVAILLNPTLAIQNVLGVGTLLQALLAGFFTLGGIVGFVVRLRGRYRAEKIALTLTRGGLLMYLVVLLFASGTGYPSTVGVVIVALLFTYLDRQRLETKILEHTSGRGQQPT